MICCLLYHSRLQVFFPVNILLKSTSTPIENTLKTYHTCSTLPSECGKWQKFTHANESDEGLLLEDPQGNAGPQHIWVNFPISVKRIFFFLHLANALNIRPG